MSIHRLILIAIATYTVVQGCQNAPKLKSYQYIETKREQSLFGGFDETKSEPKIIKAENDSIAYCAAYQSFCIAQKVNRDMKKEYGKYNLPSSEPISFQLLSPDGSDITYSVSFMDYEKVKKEIEDRIFSMSSSIEGAGERMEQDRLNNFRNTARVDSATISRLKPGFRIKKDEFDTMGTTWYRPRTAPLYVNYNALYMYFGCQQEMPTTLRLRMQYQDDSWLFIRSVQFSIDGKPYEYTPSNLERDSGNGGQIWEWFDDAVDYSNKEIVLALYGASTARMRLVGDQYHKEKTITSTQLNEIKKTIDLYRAMGGQL